MKFKVGDRVRVVDVKHDCKKHLVGKDFIIKKGFKGVGNMDVYDIGVAFLLNEPELELVVKPKFYIADYPGKYVMHCTTEEEAKTFCEYLHSVGEVWSSGSSYLERTNYNVYTRNTCYYFNYGEYCRLAFYKGREYTILEFEDFDWSDFMKKEFTKNDLKNGDVVKRRNGEVGIVCVETNAIIFKDGPITLSRIGSDLRDRIGDSYDIVAIRRPMCSEDCAFYAFTQGYGELVYERKEVEEMTLEEVCKALGKEIKIVKK